MRGWRERLQVGSKVMNLEEYRKNDSFYLRRETNESCFRKAKTARRYVLAEAC